MATYLVKVPITAIAYVEVEADSEEEAITEACNSVELEDLEEWQTHDQIVQGNVFHGLLNKAEIESVEGLPEDDEDEE